MSLRGTFDQIFDHLIRGELKQTVHHMDELTGEDRADLVAYIAHDLKRPEEALHLCRVYFCLGYRFESKRYIVFSGSYDTPIGGIGDSDGLFDIFSNAEDLYEQRVHESDWAQLYDTYRGKIVKESHKPLKKYRR